MVETKARIGKALNADRILLTSRGPSYSPVKPVTEVKLASDHMEPKEIEVSPRRGSMATGGRRRRRAFSHILINTSQMAPQN